MEADLREALDFWRSGQKAKAFLVLKKSRRLSCQEATDLLEETAAQEPDQNTGFTKHADGQLEAAIEQMSAWDDLVLDVLQSISHTGALNEAPPKEPDWRESVRLCESIHQSVVGLLRQGINPSRAMAAYSQKVFPTLLDKASGTEIVVRDLEQTSTTLKSSVPRHSLHADLITLL